MRPTKSTTARSSLFRVILPYVQQFLTTGYFRNLYAIFYMTEHPNATTMEFSAAFKNLDKATILVSDIIIAEIRVC